jgi:hypothetical protein
VTSLPQVVIILSGTGFHAASDPVAEVTASEATMLTNFRC